MRYGHFAVVVGLLVIFAGLIPAAAHDDWNDDSRYTEKSEIHETYSLSPGAAVTVNDIAGPVTIETWDGTSAQVDVWWSAPTREDLDRKRVVVEQSSSSLAIHTISHKMGSWNHSHVRQSVSLRLPRSVELKVWDIAGSVKIGAIDGSVKVNDVAGSLTVESAVSPHINDIAGSVTLSVSSLGPDGVRINDIAGRVELNISASTDADVDIEDISGKIDVDVANVAVLGKIERESFHGRIGNGGPRISINDIAGSVRVRNL